MGMEINGVFFKIRCFKKSSDLSQLRVKNKPHKKENCKGPEAKINMCFCSWNSNEASVSRRVRVAENSRG